MGDRHEPGGKARLTPREVWRRFVPSWFRSRRSRPPTEFRVLYGGSVNAKNVGEIVAQDDVDGALVWVFRWTASNSPPSRPSPFAGRCRRGGAYGCASTGRLAAAILALQIILVITSIFGGAAGALHRAKGGGLVHLVRWRRAVQSVWSTVVEKNLDRLTHFVVGIWVVPIIGMAPDRVQLTFTRRGSETIVPRRRCRGLRHPSKVSGSTS